MNEKLGIPYMGSKRKLAPEILSKITQRHHGLTDFYDLFGGGGSVSFTAIRDYRFNVHYNELNKHIYSLVEYLKSHKELEPKFYEWVTREEFFNQINKSNEDADWFSGFVMSCWSFGNSQNSYLYGSDIEQQKQMLHEIIVNKCEKSILEFEKITNVKIEDYFLKGKDVQDRKNHFTRILKKLETNQFYRTFNQDVQNQTLFQQLARIQHLGAIQNLQNIQNLKISNTSYENVLINPNNPVIYCDIPYKGTGEYKEGNFDHDKFYQWANDIDYPVYISEYDAPFERIEGFKHRSSMSATNNKKQTFESIFWNGKGDITNNKLF